MKIKHLILSLFVALFMFAGQANAADRINLNSASVEQLQTLSGIGAQTAAAIAAYRDEHGLFATVDDLIRVKGIGQKKLDSIREAIEVGQ